MIEVLGLSCGVSHNMCFKKSLIAKQHSGTNESKGFMCVFGRRATGQNLLN